MGTSNRRDESAEMRRTPGRVLLIGDGAGPRGASGTVLERAGFDVTFASDWRTARARIAVDRPDLVIVDPELLGTSAVELLRQMRAETAMKGVPIFVITSAELAWHLEGGLEPGSVDCLVAPVDPRVLRARVAMTCRARRGAAPHRNERMSTMPPPSAGAR